MKASRFQKRNVKVEAINPGQQLGLSRSDVFHSGMSRVSCHGKRCCADTQTNGPGCSMACTTLRTSEAYMAPPVRVFRCSIPIPQCMEGQGVCLPKGLFQSMFLLWARRGMLHGVCQWVSSSTNRGDPHERKPGSFSQATPLAVCGMEWGPHVFSSALAWGCK